MQYTKIIRTTVTAMALVAMLAGCANTGVQEKIAYGKAQQGNLTGEIRISGALTPAQSATVSTQIAGLITAVPVKEGSMVKKGQLLVQLDARNSQAELSKSKAKINQTQFTIEQSKSSLDDATRDLERYKQLYAAGGVSEKQLEAYKTTATNAKLSYDAALKGAMPVAQDEAEIASLTLSKSRIVSPIDGMVVAVSANAGENVLPGSALITVVNTEVFELSGNIGEAEVSCIAIGQKCSVAADAVPGKSFPAQVSFVSPISIASGSSFPVRLQIVNSDGTLRAGMNAAASIAVTQSGFILPENAVFEENGKSYVFADNNGKAHKTAVMIGLKAKGKVVVLSGMNQKTNVIIQGADGMLEGDKLE